jgi:hypothetical protein
MDSCPIIFHRTIAVGSSAVQEPISNAAAERDKSGY